jgi:hypothetical protein
LLRGSRFLHPQCMEHAGLVGVDRRHPGDGITLRDADTVMLDTRQLLQRPLWRQPGLCRMQACAHHPVQDQGPEADLCVGADALGKGVVHRPDRDLGLEYPEATLDVGKCRDLMMRQTHRAGETLFVDCAGQTVPVIDRQTGEVRPAQVFVAVPRASPNPAASAVHG